MEERFTSELVELRKRLAAKQKIIVSSIRKRAPWLSPEETIPLEVAKGFIKASAWWLAHSSGMPVKAPKHADRIYKSHHGWAIDFGANTFLVGKAVDRCRKKISEFLNNCSN